LDIQ